ARANGLINTSSVAIRVDRHPVITVPALSEAAENAPFTLNVVASDPDADSIGTLTADLSGLPAKNNAVFTANATRTGGTLTWTPTFDDSGGPYHITLNAGNALSTSVIADLHVANTDPAPVITA